MPYTFSSQRYSSHTPTARLDYAVSCWRQVGAWPLLTDMAYRYLTRKYRPRSFSTRYWVSIYWIYGYRRTRNLEKKKLCPWEICLRVVMGGSKVAFLSRVRTFYSSRSTIFESTDAKSEEKVSPRKICLRDERGKVFSVQGRFFFQFFSAFHFSFETYKGKHGLFSLWEINFFSRQFRPLQRSLLKATAERIWL